MMDDMKKNRQDNTKSPYEFQTLGEIRRSVKTEGTPTSPHEKPERTFPKERDLAASLKRHFAHPWDNPIILRPEDLTYQKNAEAKLLGGLAIFLSLLAFFYGLDCWYFAV